MRFALVLLAAALQDDDPVKVLEGELAKRMKTYEKFTVGAFGEALRTTLQIASVAEQRGLEKRVPAVLETGLDTINRAILALETKPPELRRALGYLDKAKKRAAAVEEDAKKASALRYGIERAYLVWQTEVNATVSLANLAIDFIGSAGYDEAEEALKEVEERLPAVQGATMADTPEAPRLAPIFMSRIHLARGQWKEAAAALKRGIDRAPEWGDREIDIRKMHKEKEYARIRKAIDENAAKNADDPDALLLQAYEVFFSADRKKAQPLLEAILKKDAKNKYAQYFLERIPDE